MTLAGIVGALCLAVGPLHAEMPAAAQITPLTENQAKLLKENHFQIQPNGSVIDPATSGPVATDRLPLLIQNLEGRKRLQALLKLNIILNKSEGEKNLTREERDSIRSLLRENWPLFNMETRKNFRRYFSLEELEGLDLVPLPKARLPEPELRDGEPAALTTVATAPVSTAMTPSAPVIPPAIAPSVVVAPSIPKAAPPIMPEPAMSPPTAPPAVVASPISEPPAVTTSAVIAPPTPQAALATPRAIPLQMIPAEEFERFLVEAPYSKDVKTMLRLIAAKAPFARLRVLNDIVSTIPRIALDADRCGAQTYSHSVAESSGTTFIALNPGVMMRQKSLLFFKGTASYLPLSAKAPEGSQKILFSTEQQAGSLLAELVRLDARLRGWDSSVYATQTAARTAQWIFYDVLAREAGNDDFLRGDIRVSYRLWRDRPCEYHDWLFNSLAASQGEAMDTSRIDPKAQAVLAEAVEAERHLRRERQSHAIKD